MASKKDDDLVKIISQIKNQVKEAINQSERTREAVNQQVTDLQHQVSEFHNRSNEVLNNHVKELQSFEEQCSKLLESPPLLSDQATTDAEICTS